MGTVEPRLPRLGSSLNKLGCCRGGGRAPEQAWNSLSQPRLGPAGGAKPARRHSDAGANLSAAAPPDCCFLFQPHQWQGNYPAPLPNQSCDVSEKLLAYFTFSLHVSMYKILRGRGSAPALKHIHAPTNTPLLALR